MFKNNNIYQSLSDLLNSVEGVKICPSSLLSKPDRKGRLCVYKIMDGDEPYPVPYAFVMECSQGFYVSSYVDGGVEFEPIGHRFGSEYKIEEFREHYKEGSIMSYDGFGKYATRDLISNEEAVPGDPYDGNGAYTHVIWYNK